MKKLTAVFICVFMLAAAAGCGAEKEVAAPEPIPLSETVYPEYILLSENHWEAVKLYSPIDRAYNKSRLYADFIDSYASEFTSIWRKELDYQYAKCLNNMPEKHKKEFAAQQSAWETYYDNDVFPEIAFFEGTGYGYTREAFLIRLDRVRRRTIEIMRIQTHIEGISVAFSDEVTRPIIALLEEENPKYTGEGIWIRAIEAERREAADEEFFLENKVVYRKRANEKPEKIEEANVNITALDNKTILWFVANPEVMECSRMGIYFFDDEEIPLFFLPHDFAFWVNDVVIFSPDGKQMVVGYGTTVVWSYDLYDFKKIEKKASFDGMTRPRWLDSHRFALTMVEPDAEPPRDNGSEFNGWTSVVVYDTETGKITPVMKATETQDYMLVGADLGKGELRISETSVRTKDDWPDYKKYQKKEITVKAP